MGDGSEAEVGMPMVGSNFLPFAAANVVRSFKGLNKRGNSRGGTQEGSPKGDFGNLFPFVTGWRCFNYLRPR